MLHCILSMLQPIINTMSKYLFFLLLVFPPAFATNTQLVQPIHVNMVFPRAESSIIRRVLEPIYKESFKRLGGTVSFRGCVPSKCGKYVTNGKADGEMARALIYHGIYPELVRTKENIFTINVSAFSTAPSIELDSWDDLIGDKYKVAYIGAYYLIDKNVRERINSKNIIYVNHWVEGLNKLSMKNADIYIGVERTILNELKGKETPIHNVGVLKTVSLYPYFNRKHKLLAEKLELILKEMKMDGTMNKLLSDYTH